MIIDSSIIVELVLTQPQLAWVESTLRRVTGHGFSMSWVNMVEAGMGIGRTNPALGQDLEPTLLRLGIAPLGLDQETVRLAIEARGQFPLNFGDCFAYAHAKLMNQPLITLDDDFLKTDLAAVIHPSRG